MLWSIPDPNCGQHWILASGVSRSKKTQCKGRVCFLWKWIQMVENISDHGRWTSLDLTGFHCLPIPNIEHRLDVIYRGVWRKPRIDLVMKLTGFKSVLQSKPSNNRNVSPPLKGLPFNFKCWISIECHFWKILVQDWKSFPPDVQRLDCVDGDEYWRQLWWRGEIARVRPPLLR